MTFWEVPVQPEPEQTSGICADAGTTETRAQNNAMPVAHATDLPKTRRASRLAKPPPRASLVLMVRLTITLILTARPDSERHAALELQIPHASVLREPAVFTADAQLRAAAEHHRDAARCTRRRTLDQWHGGQAGRGCGRRRRIVFREVVVAVEADIGRESSELRREVVADLHARAAAAGIESMAALQRAEAVGVG